MLGVTKVNYLYNGIEAPELPELNGQYAVLYKKNNGSINLGVMPDANAYREFTILFVNYTRPIYGIKIDDSTRYGKHYVLDNGIWVDDGINFQNVQVSKIDADGNNVPVHNIFWSNYDIPNEVDGGIYLAASDPIPVGSAPEVEPKSFMAGLRMGQFIRGMRG